MSVYHERQLGGLCGVHCLNNLLQGPRFGPGDLAEIGVELDQAEKELLHTGVTTHGGEGENAHVEHQPYNVDSSADGGNFSIQVLSVALSRFGLELLPARHPSAVEQMKDPANAAEAFLCQYSDHWFAVRAIADCWWNLNSTRKRPALVGPFYLAAWLAQLGAEGYSIFLLQGSALPESAKPQQKGIDEENFHCLFELLERGKRCDGNPLGRDEDSEEEVQIPPDFQEEPMIFPGMYPEDGFVPLDVPFVQGVPLGAMGGMPLNHPLAEGVGPVNGGNSYVDVQSLREMGFRELQILAAQELAGGLGEDVSQLLMQVQGLDPAIEHSGERLGNAIHDAVLSLDTGSSDAAGMRILQLATLLSFDETHLKAASDHVDMTVLTEFLLSITAQRAQTWPRSVSRAASVIVSTLRTVQTAPQSGGTFQGSSPSAVSTPAQSTSAGGASPTLSQPSASRPTSSFSGPTSPQVGGGYHPNTRHMTVPRGDTPVEPDLLSL